jgi:methylphosphotriester-DNA--protein-cysteine methyltransferase
MIKHHEISDSDLRLLLKTGQIAFGGNAKDKIYGLLTCKQGKRLTKEIRVFFHSEAEAIENGFRPCGSCMRNAYKIWKERENP